MQETYYLVVLTDGNHMVLPQKYWEQLRETDENWLVSIRVQSIFDDIMYTDWKKVARKHGIKER